jgi:uncharacterized iron-regulated protein
MLSRGSTSDPPELRGFCRPPIPWCSSFAHRASVLLALMWVAGGMGELGAQERQGIPPTPPPPSGSSWGLEAVAFLAGCWESGPEEGGLLLEERYSPARGGVMLGSSRYFREGNLTSFEFSRIVESGGGVVLVPQPEGRAPTVGFRLTSAGTGRAIFENPRHDSPVRIEYTMAEEGGKALHVGVVGADGEGSNYSLRPVPCSGPGASTDLPDHRVYRGDGTPLSLEQALEEMARAEVVFLGENHDDEVAHRLQALILEEMQGRVGARRPVILSMEMFESDVQGVLDEYRAGLITEDHFLRSSRPWPRYADHYRPMVEFARTHGLAVVAANPPRRYVNLVGREGPAALERLSPAALSILPPLPLAPPSDRYRAQWDSLMGGAGMAGTPGVPAQAPQPDAPHPPAVSNGLWAQTLWDAGMAHAVATALGEHQNALVVHLAGAFHVNRGTGIPEHLVRLRSRTRMLTVIFAPVEPGTGFQPDRHHQLGDLVILTQASTSQTSGDR